MEKTRERFEAWYRGHMLHDEGEHFTTIESTINSYKQDRDKYGYSDIQEMWLAWKASSAALCVELPRSLSYPNNNMVYLSDVEDRLEKAGVSYK